jgi:hypothetical protein
VRAVNDDAMETRFACNAVLRPAHSLSSFAYRTHEFPLQPNNATQTKGTRIMDTNLLILLTTEQARCRQVARHYIAMGSIGCFAAAMLEELQHRADHVIIHGQEADIRACLTTMQAVRQPPLSSATPSPSFVASRTSSADKPSLATAIASVGRRIPRLALAGAI